MKSSNSIFVDGPRVECLNLTGKVAVRPGIAGPEICLVVDAPKIKQPMVGFDFDNSLAELNGK